MNISRYSIFRFLFSVKEAFLCMRLSQKPNLSTVISSETRQSRTYKAEIASCLAMTERNDNLGCPAFDVIKLETKIIHFL